MRTCSRCKTLKDDTKFGHVMKGEKRYLRGVCRDCMNAPRTLGISQPPGPHPGSYRDFDIDVIPPEPPTAPEPGVPRDYPPVEHGRASYEGVVFHPPRADVSKILIIPDVHRPYHDKNVWSLVMRAAAQWHPDKIVVMGDFGDFYSVSSFDKHPKRVQDLKTEAEDVNQGLDELDALGAAHKFFIKGNHEDRLERYLCKSAPALFGCVSVDDLFHLKERSWNITEYKRSMRLGKLRMTHDTGTAGINAHRQSVDAFQAPAVIGHTHRMEMSFRGNADGNPTVGAMFGWLGDFEAIDYMHQVKAKRDWVHGFGIGYQEESTGIVHLQPVPIVKGSCCLEGRIYR